MENGVATEQKWYFFGANAITTADFSGKIFYEVQNDGTMPSTIDGNFIIGFSASNANAINFEENETSTFDMVFDNGDWTIESRQLKLRGLDENLQATQYSTTLIPMYKGDDTSTYHYEFATIDYTGSTVDDLSTTYFKELKDININLITEDLSGKKITVTGLGYIEFTNGIEFVNDSADEGNWELVGFGNYQIVKLTYDNGLIEYLIVQGTPASGSIKITIISPESSVGVKPDLDATVTSL
jgi:hypothetical protein